MWGKFPNKLLKILIYIHIYKSYVNGKGRELFKNILIKNIGFY